MSIENINISSEAINESILSGTEDQLRRLIRALEADRDRLASLVEAHKENNRRVAGVFEAEIERLSAALANATSDWPISWGTPVRKSGVGYSGPGVMSGYAMAADGSLRLTVGHKLEGGTGELLHMPAQVEIDGGAAFPAISEPAEFQSRVGVWMHACFGAEISADMTERIDRCIEEVFETAQSLGYPEDRIEPLRRYVYGRPAGDPAQELGGMMVTIAALANACGLDMAKAGETELARVWTKIDTIRAKQAAKPKLSPLPIAVAAESGLEAAPRRFRHRKRGSTYVLVGYGVLQSAHAVADGAEIAVYRRDDLNIPQGCLWVRPTAEFHDGRFEELPPVGTAMGGDDNGC